MPQRSRNANVTLGRLVLTEPETARVVIVTFEDGAERGVRVANSDDALTLSSGSFHVLDADLSSFSSRVNFVRARGLGSSAF